MNPIPKPNNKLSFGTHGGRGEEGKGFCLLRFPVPSFPSWQSRACKCALAPAFPCASARSSHIKMNSFRTRLKMGTCTRHETPYITASPLHSNQIIFLLLFSTFQLFFSYSIPMAFPHSVFARIFVWQTRGKSSAKILSSKQTRGWSDERGNSAGISDIINKCCALSERNAVRVNGEKNKCFNAVHTLHSPGKSVSFSNRY